MGYEEKLNQTRTSFPFRKWEERFDNGLEQYTKENRDRMQKIFENLIEGLIGISENAPEEEKVELFRIAIEATNELDEEESLIETEEREELCELTNVISIAAGLDPKNYGEGEGLASEWREW